MNNKKYITLTLTESCNLDCTYCYENHKSKQPMSFETAKQIIDFESENADEYELVEFDLFGGEPFLQFELIKQIEDYIKHLNVNMKYVLFVSTNGTMIHGEIKQWLTERKDHFVCGLSYDGTYAMQDMNRTNSSKLIDLNFFRDTYPFQDIKMTISAESLNTLSDGVIFLHEKGFRVSCNLAYNIDWSNQQNKEIINRELNKLITFYIDNPEIEPCSMLNMPISNVTLTNKNKKMIQYCGAGLSTKAYHIDGTAYPCQFFMPLSIGKEKAMESHKLKFYRDSIPEELAEEKCKTCVVQSICPTCFGSNYASTGDIYKHDENYCELTKLILKARSYFKAKQWEAGQLKLEPMEEQALLRSIKIIQSNL